MEGVVAGQARARSDLAAGNCGLLARPQGLPLSGGGDYPTGHVGVLQMSPGKLDPWERTGLRVTVTTMLLTLKLLLLILVVLAMSLWAAALLSE